MTMVGAGMLWVGWFGFNGGSALAANGAAGMAMLATHLAASPRRWPGWRCEWSALGKPTSVGLVTGVVAGLATITPASGYVGPMGAIVDRRRRRRVCFFATSLIKQRLQRRRFARRVRGARRRRHARHAARRAFSPRRRSAGSAMPPA